MNEKYINEDLAEKLNRLKALLEYYTSKDIAYAHKRRDVIANYAKNIFITRAGMKLAEVDFLSDNLISADSTKNISITSDCPFYFADLCCGSGSFSEYILWKRRGWTAKGFCTTLKSDIQISNNTMPSRLIFTGSAIFHFGTGDGDIFNPENIESFVDFVMSETVGEGVHTAVADGAFSCAGNENLQEITSLDIFICQAIVALRILRLGGNFVMKIFDTFTVNTAALLITLCSVFETCSIIKPTTSRPSNSEKYLTFFSAKSEKNNIAQYLLTSYINNKKTAPSSPIMLLPPSKIDPLFIDHLRTINNLLFESQQKGLELLFSFLRSKNKKRKYNIYEIGSYFYTLGLPIKIQPDFPIFVSTFSRAAKIFTISFKEWFKKKATKFDPTNILLLSLANKKCLQCLNLNNFDLEESWSDFREVVIKLPPLTLLKITCNSDKFVVLDAYYIYNEAIWNFPLQERKKSIKILCQTMSDSSDKTITHTLAENSNVLV